MSDLVPAAEIEGIVGVKRHATEHWGRAVSAEKRVYILHSQECLDDPTWGLQDCFFSLALDQGINPAEWVEDVPVRLAVREELRRDWLIPCPESHECDYEWTTDTDLDCRICGKPAGDVITR